MYGTRIYKCVCRLNSSIRRLYYFYLNNQEAIEFTNNKAGGETNYFRGLLSTQPQFLNNINNLVFPTESKYPWEAVIQITDKNLFSVFIRGN